MIQVKIIDSETFILTVSGQANDVLFTRGAPLPTQWLRKVIGEALGVDPDDPTPPRARYGDDELPF